MFAALPMLAQEHKWAGRTLNDLEWRIHEELSMLPFHGVCATLRFDLRYKTVTLSGQVVRETVKTNAERVIKRLDGVDRVVNQIEVLPSSRRDDAIRMNVYRAIYEKQPLALYHFYGVGVVPTAYIKLGHLLPLTADGAETEFFHGFRTFVSETVNVPDLSSHFRVTISAAQVRAPSQDRTDLKVTALLRDVGALSTAAIARHAGLSPRATLTRLKNLKARGILVEIATGPHDPQAPVRTG